jgi:Tol biopolymer transport system component
MQNKEFLMLKRIGIIAALFLLVVVALLGIKTPRTQVLQTDRVLEASGLAQSLINDNVLYSHNDSGGEASVFAIDTQGKLLAEIVIEGASNRDWEDIATAIDPEDGKAYIYIGEIGDNGARHPSVKIYRVPEPRLNTADSLYQISDVETYSIVYEDGARDAEALFIEPKTGDIYIISKREEQVGIYQISYPPSTLEVNTARKLGTMKMSWVTAADISPDGKYILVKNYPGIRRYKKGKRRSVLKALSGKGKNMPYSLEPQGEAVCFDPKGKGYYTLSEASADAPQVLYYYK